MRTNERMWMRIGIPEYHALPGISSSAVRCFVLDGPLEYYARYVARIVEPEDTKAKRMGRAFHRAMECPDTWESHYVITPSHIEDDEFVAICNQEAEARGSQAAKLMPGDEINLRLALHRRYLELFRQSALEQDKEMLSHDEVDVVRAQVAAVLDNPACREYVGKGQAEMACIWHEPDTSLQLKALCDLVVSDVIVDYKTTRTRNPFDFARQAERDGYLYQAAHYCLVTGFEEFKFIAITNAPPYCASAFYVPRVRLVELMSEIRNHLAVIRQLMALSEMSNHKDSQGIPIEWMPDGWGAEYPLDLQSMLKNGTIAH